MIERPSAAKTQRPESAQRPENNRFARFSSGCLQIFRAYIKVVSIIIRWRIAYGLSVVTRSWKRSFSLCPLNTYLCRGSLSFTMAATLGSFSLDFACSAPSHAIDVIFNRVAHSARPWKWKRRQGIRDKKLKYYETVHVGMYKKNEKCNVNNNETRCRNGLVQLLI